MVSGVDDEDARARAAAPSMPEGLAQWLLAVGLSGVQPAVEEWCTEQGAKFLEEVAENADALAAHLGLPEDEAQRVIGGAQRALEQVHRSMQVKSAALFRVPSDDSNGCRPTSSLWRTVSSAACAGGGALEQAKGPCSISKALTIESPWVRARQALGEQRRNGAGETGTCTPRASGGLAPTMTWTMGGPLSGLLAAMPVKDGQIAIAEMHRHKIYRDKSATHTLRRCDTVGGMMESSRQSLIEKINTPGKKISEIDDGQTGTVYALKIDGENIAVFKPVDGEKFSRKGLDIGQGAIREEAVYLVDRLCGSQAMVPVTSRATVSVDDRVLEGSVQAFVAEVLGPAEDFAMPRDPSRARGFVAQETAEALALLDMRVFNMDRHSGNLLLLGSGEPHGLGPIDHGCCLPPWWCLSEANFEAWYAWPQLESKPSDSARCAARNAADRLPGLLEMLPGIGLDAASLVTLRVCTLLVEVGIVHLGVPCRQLAAAMLRDEETGFEELSWLETKVLEHAGPAGARVQKQINVRGCEELAVEDRGEGLNVDVFLHGLRGAFLRELAPVPAVHF